MEAKLDLTGAWSGHYYQHDRAAPIRAELVQDGERLSGTMRDGEPDRSMPVADAVAEAGLPPGADERIVASLREMLPDAPSGPVRFVSHLPAEATLDGSVQGPVVEFIKSYCGEHFSGYAIGERIVGQRIVNHSVHYRGKLSADGTEIEGMWWIDSPVGSGARRSEGWFRLRREQ